MGQPAPIPRRSSHLGSAACYGRSDHGSHSSTSAASSRSKRRQGNHNQFQTLKMFPDGHLVGPQHEGLLGMALHPKFLQGTGNDFVYVTYTYDADPGEAAIRRAK